MATNTWKELPEQSGGGGSGVDSLNGLTGPLAITSSSLTINASGSTIAIEASGNANTFAGFDNAGNLYSIPGFSIDTASGGMSESLTEHPNDGGGFTANSFSVSFEPLQDSPNEDWNIQNIQVFLDNASSGFNQGVNGSALQMLSLGINHNGTGDVGGLSFLTMNYTLGNGTDPISFNGLAYSYGFGSVAANVTINGGIQGYGYQPNINAAAIGTSSFNMSAFYDFANVGIPVNGYSSFSAGPTIAEISNGSNYNGMSLNPIITTLTGNAGLYGFGFYPSVTTVGATGQITGLNMNPIVTTMGATSNFQGVSIGGTFTTMGASSNLNGVYISPTITTSHGNVRGFSFNPVISGGDASFTGVEVNPTGGATLNDPHGMRIVMSSINSNNPQGTVGIESDSRVQINGTTQLVSAQTFQIGSRLEHLYTVPIGSPVTGTDSLGVNIAGDFLVQDNVANGPVGIGFNSVGFIASMAVAATKTVDTVTIFLPASSLPDPGFATGGTVTDFHMIRTFPPLAQGGTLNITNLYAFKLDSAFGAFSSAATNAYGIYLDDNGIKNRLYGSVQYTTNSKSANYTIDSGAVKDYAVLVDTTGGVVIVTLPAPTAGRYLIVKDSGGNALVNNITISPHAAETIDGAASVVMNLNYQSETLISDGTNWFLV